MPFLFDTASMPDHQLACAHCPPIEVPWLCCGVCQFAGAGTCEHVHPSKNKSAGMAQQFMRSGFQLRVSGGVLCRISDMVSHGPSRADQHRRRCCRRRQHFTELPARHVVRCTARWLQAFSPCELFARIRGRTLWFMGDSQTFHFFYSAECFLREFAPSLRRT